MGKAATVGVDQRTVWKAAGCVEDAYAALMNAAEVIEKLDETRYQRFGQEYRDVAAIVVKLRRGLPGGRAA